MAADGTEGFADKLYLGRLAAEFSSDLVEAGSWPAPVPRDRDRNRSGDLSDQGGEQSLPRAREA